MNYSATGVRMYAVARRLAHTRGLGSMPNARSLSMATSSGLSFEISETQKELQKMARDFTLDIILPQAPIYDENMKFPQDIFTKAWELGLINTRIPEAYGGLGLSCT